MRNRRQGFTLIELIGVLAAMAILASIMAPGIVQTLNRAYATAEESNLETLADQLRLHVERTRSIPSTNVNVWTTALAANSEFSAAQIRTNRRNQTRVLVADPGFFTGVDSAFGGYTQSTGLGLRPVSPRMMLISNLAAPVPALAANSAAFDAVWNQTAGAAVVEGPDLKIERLHFGNMFHEVLLTNANSASAGVAFDGNAATAVPAAVGSINGSLSRFVIEGTRVQLFAATFPVGGLQNTYIARRDASREYVTDDGSVWFWSAR